MEICAFIPGCCPEGADGRNVSGCEDYMYYNYRIAGRIVYSFLFILIDIMLKMIKIPIYRYVILGLRDEW
jgi:hypothetical protein